MALPHGAPCPYTMGWHSLTVLYSQTPCALPGQGDGTGPWCPMSHLLAEAPRFESIMEDIDAQEGETPRFVVVVEGKPLPDIMWYKVGCDLPTCFLTHSPPRPTSSTPSPGLLHGGFGVVLTPGDAGYVPCPIHGERVVGAGQRRAMTLLTPPGRGVAGREQPPELRV